MTLIGRALMKYMLVSQAKKHRRANRPILATFAFDHITTKIHLDGRFSDRELKALETVLFPKLPELGVCLDIGANIGNHSVCFADHFRQVHAFEPNPRVFALLAVNAKLSSNIFAHPIGLSDRTQTIEAIEPEGNFGGTGKPSAKTSPKDRLVQLELKTLDDWASTLSREQISFVKIDVEGHEQEVILGGARTLKYHYPVLGLEVSRHDIHDGTTKAVKAAYALGYQNLYGLQQWPRPSLRRLSKLNTRNYPLVIMSKDQLV